MTSPYAQFATQTVATPQSQPIPGREAEMVANNAGGFGFVLDDWERLNRFLILGSLGGTYYVGEQKLTAENAATVIRCIKADGVRTVEAAREVNVNNRAPKTDQQLFVLALAMKYGDEAAKAAVAAATPSMLRTGTHLLHFVAMLDGLGGWNRSKRRVVAKWFEDREAGWVAYQVLKYANRDGWQQRDVLRVAHPKATTEAHRAVYQWVCGRAEDGFADMPKILHAYQAMHALVTEGVPGSAVAKALFGILQNLPREALPTEALNDPAVWRALLPQTPIHALIRNLGNLTEKGIIANGAADVPAVVAKLTDADGLKKARVHPFAILLATLIYKGGTGIRGSKTWVPVKAVMDALEDAYDSAFATVKPTGKRILVAIDISSSMTHACVGTPISCSTAAAAMAITLARSEPNAVVVQFDTAVQSIKPVTKWTGIASLESVSGGGTDVASPVLWALGANPTRGRRSDTNGPATPTEPFDAFVILTDSETWAGRQHPAQALEAYRRKINPKAKLVCCSMAANHANVVDPNDPLSLGCAGLDANLPSIVAEFIGR